MDMIVKDSKMENGIILESKNLHFIIFVCGYMRNLTYLNLGYRVERGGHWQSACVVVQFQNSERPNKFEFSSSDRAKKFYNELLTHLKSVKSFESSNVRFME